MSGTERLVTLQRLTAMLDAYGADAGRWPEEERTAALALIDSSAEARCLFDEAKELDHLLDRVDEPAVSPALARSVHAIRPPAPGTQVGDLIVALIDRLRPGTQSFWQGAVAAAAIAGIATGIGLSQITFDRAAPVTASTVAPSTVAATEETGAEPADAPVLAGEPAGADFALNAASPLAPDITQISLTGNDGANSGSIVQPDDSEIAVASIPLY